jgi:hypothetical protein
VASFGISMPDQLAAELDAIAQIWYTNRSSALTRIFLEWKQNRSSSNSITPVDTDALTQPSKSPVANHRSPIHKMKD